MELHRSLLLSNKIGGTIVGTSTIIFMIMLVTGIILWWLKNKKKMRKQRLWFRWEKVKGWRRKNYDVHNILGFYASFLAVIVAITGIMYSFRVTQMWLYVLLNGFSSATPDYSQYKTTAPESVETVTTIDRIIEQVKTHYPKAYSFGLDLKITRKQITSTII